MFHNKKAKDNEMNQEHTDEMVMDFDQTQAIAIAEIVVTGLVLTGILRTIVYHQKLKIQKEKTKQAKYAAK